MVQLGAIAEYVDKKPGDTLVNQPTKFDLVIDFMMAKALGLTVPRSRCSAAPTGGSNNTSSRPMGKTECFRLGPGFEGHLALPYCV